ncbi:accessory gene regulator B family protein [Clostridiaceae bacterium 35-E11]
MEKLAQNLTNFIQLNNPNLSDLQIKKIKFGLECFIGELTKFIIYIILFSMFSLTKYFLVAALFFCVPRTLAGGYHEETYWRCFITSLLIFTSIVFIGVNITLSFPIRFLLIAFIMVLMWMYAPVDHPNKPIISVQRRKRFRYLSLFVTALFIVISFLLPQKYTTVTILALFVEAISLPMGEYIKRRSTNETING